MRGERAASFRPITGGRLPRTAKPDVRAGSAAGRLARALARRYGQPAPRPVLPMIHRHRDGYGRIFLSVLAPRYYVDRRPHLRLTLADPGVHRRLPADRIGPAAQSGRTHREHRLVERIRATARTLVERRRRVEIVARPVIRVLRASSPPEARTVLPRKAPSPGWVQPPPMLVARQRLAGRIEPIPADAPTGAIDDRRPAAASAPLRVADPATGALPLGQLQIERLIEEVIRGIDRRFVSLRERMGRG